VQRVEFFPPLCYRVEWGVWMRAVWRSASGTEPISVSAPRRACVRVNWSAVTFFLGDWGFVGCGLCAGICCGAFIAMICCMVCWLAC
jgi:hypothetical protein